jgi:hypothetical protein
MRASNLEDAANICATPAATEGEHGDQDDTTLLGSGSAEVERAVRRTRPAYARAAAS